MNYGCLTEKTAMNLFVGEKILIIGGRGFVGSGRSVDCREVVQLILKLMGRSKPYDENGEIRKMK